MRALAASLLACAALAAVVGCGQQHNSTPSACLSGVVNYEKALAKVPGEVLILGETPISDCLVPNQKAGDLARVGETLLKAVTDINFKSRDTPDGHEALALGYLMGAVQRGADRTEGIHSDLVRRLTVAARYSPGKEPLPPSFYKIYREGFDAGRSGG
jgi:hypothetical protein